jgi:hypothetical protein
MLYGDCCGRSGYGKMNYIDGPRYGITVSNVYSDSSRTGYLKSTAPEKTLSDDFLWRVKRVQL